MQPLGKNSNTGPLFLLVPSVLKKQVFSQLCIFPEPPKYYFSSFNRKYCQVLACSGCGAKPLSLSSLRALILPRETLLGAVRIFTSQAAHYRAIPTGDMFLLPPLATSSVLPKITYSSLEPSYLKLEAS